MPVYRSWRTAVSSSTMATPRKWHCALLACTLLLLHTTKASELRFSVIGDVTRWSPKAPPLQSTDFAWTKHNVIRLDRAREEVNIAYFIQVSANSLTMLPRLLDRLHHPRNVYAVHCDRKIAPHRVIRAMADIRREPRFANVHFMDRESVTYRGVTMILNNIAAVHFLLERASDWSYLINLSASDYPLVAPDVPRKLLALPHVRASAYNFFTVAPRDQWAQRKRDRFDALTVDMAMGLSNRRAHSRLTTTALENPLRDALNYDYAYSEGWFILTRDAARFLVSSAHAQRILLTMAYSQDPSEHFYLSVFWNHPDYNKTILPHSLRTVFWEHNGVSGGQHPYTIDDTLDDQGNFSLWPELRGSPHWFARKFKHPDSKVLEFIDNEMSGLGSNINETSVRESRERTDMHLQWLCGLLDD